MKGGIVFRRPVRNARAAVTDPREMVDYFYQEQLEELQRLRRRVADQAGDNRRVELQLQAAEEQRDKLEARAADQSLTAEVHDVSLGLVVSTEKRISVLQRQLEVATKLLQQETLNSLQRQELIDSFRAYKETFKAEYSSGSREVRSSLSPARHGSRPTSDNSIYDKAAEIGAIIDLLPISTSAQFDLANSENTGEG